MYRTSTNRTIGETAITGVFLSVDENFIDSSVCQEERETIETTLASTLEEIGDCDTALEFAQEAHDWLCDAVAYSYIDEEPDTSMIAHSIVGTLDSDYGAVICEGYAKTFQVLLTAGGIDNYYVVGIGGGGDHAWNLIRMDNGFYYNFDVTWDDSTRSTAYFAAGDESFLLEHEADSVDGEGWYFLYDLSDVPEENYDGSCGTSYVDGDFSYELYDDYAVLVEYLGDDTEVTIPDTINGLPVTQIQGAFVNDSSLQAVVIPETVTVISYGNDSVGAFQSCVLLKELTLPESLEYIYYRSFYDCSALETVTLSTAVEKLSAGALNECDSLSKLLIYNTDMEFGPSTTVYDKTVIYGYENSTAEVYADTYGQEFQSLNSYTTTEPTETITTTTTTTTETTTTISSTTELTTESTTTTKTATTSSTKTETTTTTETSTTTTTTTETTTTTADYVVVITDVNQDGVCALSDVIVLNRYIIGDVAIDDVQAEALDFYLDGNIDAQDSLALMDFLLRFVDTLPMIPD